MAQTIWFVRAGEGSNYASAFLEKNVIAIGFRRLGNLTEIHDNKELKNKVQEYYQEITEAQRRSVYNVVSKFRFDMKEGDAVVTYDKKQRQYHVGIITSGCENRPDIIPYLPTIRNVQWKSIMNRDDLSTSTRNSLGAIQTIFKPSSDAVNEIISKTEGVKIEPIVDEELDHEPDVVPSSKDITEQSEELIKDWIAKLSWEDLQDLVAGILEAMGYKARVSPPGPDRGVDITASPDGLGLTQPRIFVEVKHRPNEQVGTKDIRNMIGGRNPQQDKCLFVSTGGYSKDARVEATRSQVPLTLLDLDDLVELLLEYYDKMDIETQSLVPLIKIYWLIK